MISLASYPERIWSCYPNGIDRIVTVNQKVRKIIERLDFLQASSIQTTAISLFISLVPGVNFPLLTFFEFSQFRPKKDQLNLLNATEILFPEKGLDFSSFFWWRMDGDQSWKEQVEYEIQSRKLSKSGQFDGAFIRSIPAARAGSLLYLSSESRGLPLPY